MLRTSVVPGILKAGFRMNVIPSEAEATLDGRALPDEDMPKFYAEMASVIGDPAVRIEPAGDDQRPAGAPSRLDTERVPLRTHSHLGNATVEFAPNHLLHLHLFNTKQRLEDMQD